MKLVLIPPGEFTMGSPKELIEEEIDGHSDSHRPVYEKDICGRGAAASSADHQAVLLGDVYEVMQEEYQRVMG